MKNNIIELTKENDIEGVRKFIADGGDLNIQDEYGNTALFYVSGWWASLKIAKLLIDNGADLNIQNRWGKTALMYASDNNEWEMTKLLIDNKAKLDIQDDQERTALMFASKNNNFKSVELLVEAGAKLDIKDDCGFTALDIAISIYKQFIQQDIDERCEDDQKKIIKLLTPKKVDLLSEIVSYRYVKLPKYIAKRPWYSKPNSLMLYIHLLLNKSYLDRTLINNIPLLKNQLLTSSNSLEKALELTKTQIRTALNHLKIAGDIKIKGTTKYSIITLLFEESFDEKSQYKEKENLPLADIINKIAKLLDNDEIEIEIVGSWLWISGDSKQYKNEIKEAGFRFSGAKKMWFYSCKTEYKSIKSNIDIDKIRSKYGSEILKNKSQLKKWFLNASKEKR